MREQSKWMNATQTTSMVAWLVMSSMQGLVVLGLGSTHTGDSDGGNGHGGRQALWKVSYFDSGLVTDA